MRATPSQLLILIILNRRTITPRNEPSATEPAFPVSTDEKSVCVVPFSRAISAEMAFRFGVNLVMYALTGNYKADQVHVPAILERLGQ